MQVGKIVLGTVQFGLKYGINNQFGQVTQEEVNEILRVANSSGIQKLDTSYGYVQSEKVLGTALKEVDAKFKIISKYPKSDKTVGEIFQESISNLGVESLYGYLVHHFDFYKAQPAIFDEMRKLKEAGLIQKVGFSLYSAEELYYLLEHNVSFDIIQFPYNVFDRQFEPYMEELVKKGVEIHTRSAFLQGLFFKDTNTLPSKLVPLKPYLDNLHQYCHDNNITIEELAFGYVLANDKVQGALIGVDNHHQLESNIRVAGKGLRDEDINYIKSIDVKEKELLNPVNWK